MAFSHRSTARNAHVLWYYFPKWPFLAEELDSPVILCMKRWTAMTLPYSKIFAESSVTQFVDKQRLVDTVYKCHLYTEENLRGKMSQYSVFLCSAWVSHGLVLLNTKNQLLKGIVPFIKNENISFKGQSALSSPHPNCLSHFIDSFIQLTFTKCYLCVRHCS